MRNLYSQAEQTAETPSQWIEKHFYVPDPRDPVTGEVLPPGPIRLAEYQRRIIDEALARRPDGMLKYTTVVYSAPKKSGKSAVSSAVALYMAYHNPNSFVACVANDGKQSTDRLYGPIYTNFRLHKQLGGIFSEVNPNRTEVILPNYTKIEAIPCDAAGEAGSQPLGVFLSELWGFTTDKKKRVYTELTIPPTLYGRAIRWVETYAGYKGESDLLEQLYDTAVLQGTPHPEFMDLTSSLSDNGNYVVFVNERASTFALWDHEPRLPWQTKEYYVQEQAALPPEEFSRLHRNLWVSPINSFIQESWWENCKNMDLPPLHEGDPTPVVVGIDMAVSRDCAAIVAVTRDPFNPSTSAAIRAVRVFSPKDTNGIIDQERDVAPVLREWATKWNVICFVYDPREMAKLAQDLSREGLGWFDPFGQTSPRAIADKQLHDMIVHRQLSWNPYTTEGDVGYKGDSQESLYKHITQAGAVTKNEGYRIEKLSQKAKVDAAVALSMAVKQIMDLAVDNLEFSRERLLDQLSRGEISPEKFSEIVRRSNPQLERVMRDGR